MCNDFVNNIAYAEFVEALRQAQLPLRLPVAPPNLEPRDDIWPTEIAPVFRRYEGGVELARLRWGFEALPRERAGRHQLQVGRAIICEQSAMSRSRIAFLRVQGGEGPKGEVQVHIGRRAVVLFRRALERGPRRLSRELYAADNCARTRRLADPFAADGRSPARRLENLA